MRGFTGPLPFLASRPRPSASHGCLGAARDYKLPIMAVIFNNKKYAAMQGMHQKMYPDGIAAEIDLYHGTHINAPDFVKKKKRGQVRL